MLLRYFFQEDLMFNFQRIFQAEAARDPERAADAMKHMRIALNAISVQYKILSEEIKQKQGANASEKVDAIWNAIYEVPKLKSIVSREAVRKKVLENLEQMMEEEEGSL